MEILGTNKIDKTYAIATEANLLRYYLKMMLFDKTPRRTVIAKQLVQCCTCEHARIKWDNPVLVCTEPHKFCCETKVISQE